MSAFIAPSRGRTGTALDNAMAESVIATIRTELITRRPWPTRLDLELALLVWIGFYNDRRIHRSVGGQTPQEVTTSTIATTALTQRKPPNHAGAKPGTLQRSPQDFAACVSRSSPGGLGFIGGNEAPTHPATARPGRKR